MHDEDLIGISEIAKIAGVSRQAVANWRKRSSNFPSPIAELASGPHFSTFSRPCLAPKKGGSDA